MRLALVLLLPAALAACAPAVHLRAVPRPATSSVPASAPAVLTPADTVAIAALLDGYHAAASRADFDGYFGRMTEDAVFIGTDASERWTKAQFAAYVQPYFSRGRGWTYRPTVRRISLLPGYGAAFFDELLDSDAYGVCRGTGVVVRTDGGWKIAQYALTFPIPNDLAGEITLRIRGR